LRGSPFARNRKTGNSSGGGRYRDRSLPAQRVTDFSCGFPEKSPDAALLGESELTVFPSGVVITFDAWQ